LQFLIVGRTPRRLAPRGVLSLPPLRHLRRPALGGRPYLDALGDASMASLRSWGSCAMATLQLCAFLEACVGGALAMGAALLADASPCRWLDDAVLHQARCPMAASSWRRWNLLILRFGASTERVRSVWSSSDAFSKDIFSRHGGSCTVVVVSTVAAGAAPGLLSSCSVMAAPVCFPYQQRSSSGRWVFNVLSMLWWVHGISSCGVFQCLELLFVLGRWFSAGFMCVVKGFVLCWLVAI
jgi:hypothetical protein